MARRAPEEHRGCSIMVRYEGEDDSVQTQGNKLRRFKVGYEEPEEGAPNDHGVNITDADIPF